MEQQPEQVNEQTHGTSKSQPDKLSASTKIPAAGLAGLGELLEFVLPLWAASRLGLEPGTIGAVLAVELAVAFILRPLSGRLADRLDRALLAGLGAFGFAAGLGVLTLSTHVAPVFVAAVLLGAGSAFFWVPLRAMVAESGSAERSFAALTQAEGTGIWVTYVVALSLLPLLDFSGVYGAAAAVCLGLAVYIGIAGRAASPRTQISQNIPVQRPEGESGSTAKRARLTLFIAMMAAVEAAASVYLLLRFQGEFELELMEIIWFYLPGLIVYSVVPQLGVEFAERVGQRLTVATSLFLSMAGIALVTLAPQTWMLALGWALLCWSWGWLDPLQQTTSLRIFAGGFGRSMGRYESAGLAGAALGSLVGGMVLEAGTGIPVVLAALVVSALSLVLALGLYGRGAKPSPAGGVQERKVSRDPKKEFTKALEHLVIFVVVQILLIVAEMSWIADLIQTGTVFGALAEQGGTVNQMLYIGNLLWAGLVVVDLAVNGLALLSHAEHGGAETVRDRNAKKQGDSL